MKTSKILKTLGWAILATLLTASCGRNGNSGTGQAVLDNIASRTSIRAYRPQAVGADTVELLLRAAMAAPSARNLRPWAFVVVDDERLLRQLADSLPYARSAAAAPLAVVVCGVLPESEGAGSAGWWVQDCAAASENLLLAAHAVGLGAVWTGVYPRGERVRAVRNILALPGHVVPLNVIPVGYPAENPAPRRKWDASKVRRNGWAQ